MSLYMISPSLQTTLCPGNHPNTGALSLKFFFSVVLLKVKLIQKTIFRTGSRNTRFRLSECIRKMFTPRFLGFTFSLSSFWNIRA